jgi:hypothetical protein
VRAIAFVLLLVPALAHAQGASPAQADSLIAAAANYQAPMATAGLLMNRDSIVVVDHVPVLQYWPDHADSLWKVVQACSGVESPAGVLESITFSAVPGDAFWVHAADSAAHAAPDIGYTVLEHSNILILKKYMNRPDLVKHEMLHALLYITGTVTSRPWHDVRYFVPCGLAGQ